MSLRALLLAAFAAASAGGQAPCGRQDLPAPTLFFLEVARQPVDSITRVRLCLSSEHPLGSYMAIVAFDSTQVRALDVRASGGMQAVNSSVPGIIRIAGAAPAGFPAGPLATIDFRGARRTVDGVKLTIVEAASPEGKSLLSRTRAMSLASAEPRVTRPVLDSLSPAMGELDNDRVTDITIHGKGFAPRGNVVLFGDTEVTGLVSEAGGTVIRFSAPNVRATRERVAVRVSHDGMTSNALAFMVRGGKP